MNKIEDHNYSIIVENKISKRYSHIEEEAESIPNREGTITNYEDLVMAQIDQRKQRIASKRGRLSFLDRIIELKNTWELDPVHQRLERITAELVTAGLVITGIWTYLNNSSITYSLPTYLYLLKNVW